MEAMMNPNLQMNTSQQEKERVHTAPEPRRRFRKQQASMEIGGPLKVRKVLKTGDHQRNRWMSEKHQNYSWPRNRCGEVPPSKVSAFSIKIHRTVYYFFPLECVFFIMDLLLKTIFKTKTMKSRNLNNLKNELSMKQISFTKCFNFNKKWFLGYVFPIQS